MAIRVLKTNFEASHEDIDRLFACNRLSALIWNKVLEIAKSYSLDNNGKWISKGRLYKELKNIFPLHSQSVQMVADKYLSARDGAHQAIVKGYKNKYPWRRKKNFNTQWKDKAFVFDYQNRTLTLSLGIWDSKRQTPIEVRLPKDIIKKLAGVESLFGHDVISQVELIYNNRLMLCITYDDGQETPFLDGNITTAGVDLGEIHTISACADNGNSVIITGRMLRSIHRLRNKQLRSISKAQAKCTKGSRKWKKLQRKKRYILSKSAHQVAYKTHEITKNFVDWCVENKIGKVYCGDPEGVQRNTSGRKKKNRTENKKKIRKRKVAQKLSNWNFGKVMNYLEYKLAAKGILIEKINEAYSSQTCPVCGQRHKTNSRNYKCKCGYHAHRDVHGAHNILSLGLNGHFEKVCDFEKQKPKYLRLTA